MPVDLRHQVGAREICRALGTGERRLAVPMALELGAAAVTLFCHLRDPMSNPPNAAMLAILRLAKSEARRMREGEEAEARLDDEQRRARAQMAQARREHEHALVAAKLAAERDAVMVMARSAHDGREAERAASTFAMDQAMKAMADMVATTLKGIQSVPAVVMQGRPAPDAESGPTAAKALLGTYIDEYLADYEKRGNSEMLKKIAPALELVRELLGRKPACQLVQRDIEDVFNVVRRLPQRWQAACKRRVMTARELAKEDHLKLLGGKTFRDNYVVPVRLFLDWARSSRHDEGFPVNLNVRTITLGRADNTGEKSQRALKHAELQRLFHGQELQSFKADPAQAHKWWLPTLAFYTGARVNELCQLNPQTDILHDPDTDIDYVLITDETEADERVTKSVKTGVARAVPLHPELIKGGFLDYVQAVRDVGHRRLFPAWAPAKNGKASTQGENWFCDLLRDTGLRDETPYKCVLGSHVFRHTLLGAALNSSPSIDAGPLTGHAAVGKSSVQRGYEGELWLKRKFELLKAIQFGFTP